MCVLVLVRMACFSPLVVEEEWICGAGCTFFVGCEMPRIILQTLKRIRTFALVTIFHAFKLLFNTEFQNV